MSEDQVRTLLEAVRDDQELKGKSLVEIGEWMYGRFGFGFYPSFLSRVLHGESLRVRNFDYESLLVTRKSRAEVARRHWQLRRKELSAEEAS